MGDMRDRIRQGQAALERLVQSIPGFAGYQDKEKRRDADKLLRTHLVGLIDQITKRLTRIQAALSAQKLFKPVTDINRINRRLLRTRDRIEHASYGYAGFFDPVKIGTEELDRLYEYDLSLKEYIGKVDEAVAGLEGAAEDQREALLQTLSDEMDELDRMVDDRSEAAAQLAP